jgi:hypothetical protein
MSTHPPVLKNWSRITATGLDGRPNEVNESYSVLADNARLAEGMAGVPAYRQQHSEYPELLVAAKTITSISPGFWDVVIIYRTVERITKDREQQGFADRTLFWEPGTEQDEVDVDIHGNPIVNSAGGAFDRSGTKTVNVLYLTIEQTEPRFSAQWAEDYFDTVNAGTFYGFGRGRVKVAYIGPVNPFVEADTEIRYRYRFEVRKHISEALQDAHKLRRLDMGMLAARFANTGELPDAQSELGVTAQPILDASGQEITSPVRLNGMGGQFGTEDAITDKPFDDEVKIDVGPRAVFLVFQLYPFADFADLEVGGNAQ